MRKLKGILVLVLLLALLACPIAVLASDISNALYYGTIIVTNNSTATNNVAVNCSISTQALIDGGYLNSSANNCVIRSSAGADVIFQPSANASYPWCIWVPSIGQNASMADILYTANSTGGIIRYFPADLGMATKDSDTLEIGDNFTIEQKGWIDTTYSSNQTLVFKKYAFQTYISATENITSEILGGAIDIGATAENRPDDFDIGNRTCLLKDNPANATGIITQVEIWAVINLENCVVGTFYHVAGNDYKCRDSAAVGLVTAGAKRTFSGLAISVATGDLIGLYATAGSWEATNGGGIDIMRFDGEAIDPGDQATYIEVNNWVGSLYGIGLASLSVTASGVSSGNHTVTTTANTTHLWIDIDTVTKHTEALGGASVPLNNEDWTFAQNGTILYLEYQDIEIDGVQQQRIEWEYDIVFTDLSEKGHDATPSFRTASSNDNVSAVLTSFLPVAEAKAPAYALADAPGFIETVPTIVSEFDVTPPIGGFPLAGVIATIANATATPPQLPLLIIAVIVILASSLAVSATIRRYGSGSLIVKIITITAVMGVFIALKNFGIEFWMLVVFLGIAVPLAMASRQSTWN